MHNTQDDPAPSTDTQAASEQRRFEDLPAAAQRALREAESRRAAIDSTAAALPREVRGRGGKEPVRYGDWEVKGIASDF